ncbi:MAG: hypothetical protein PVH61_30090 [Candidatus Aminicenantes bacterium]|jgi:hypothetical protein
MIENINSYLILTACFFLVFIGAVIFLGKYAKPIHRFLTGEIPLLIDFPWDTLIKVLTTAGIILFLKKFLYYLSFTGIMQSKSSIWWVDKNVLLFLYYLLFLKELKPKITRSNVKFLAPFGAVFWVFLVFSFTYLPLNWEEKLLHQLQTAKSSSDFLEVLDTTKSMNNLRDESYAIKRIALEIAKAGEMQRAKLVAEQIPDEDVKIIALQEIREKVGKK